MRISGLVLSIKGFTHMDQATVAEPVDLPVGLSNTVDVLKSKARSEVGRDHRYRRTGPPEGARVHRRAESDLGESDRQRARRGGSGRTRRHHRKPRAQRVVVHIIDNGTGIPPEVQRAHVRAVFHDQAASGKGTGQGLDIVRRLVIHNDADINVDSRPGRTEFSVSLPLAEGADAGAQA